MRMSGKTAFVTAAARGIGRATALALAREGASVIATDIDVAALEELSATANITTQRLDVTDAAAINAAIQAQPLDALLNCAGFVHHGTILDCSWQDWTFSFELNVHAMYRTITAALPGMLQRGTGSIVNVASVASSIKGAPNRAVYGTTKAAVIGMTKAIAADYVARGIRCNAICPGTVDSPSWRDRVAAADDPEQARKEFISRQPMGRVGTAEEIAALALYLASDESAFTTGVAHVIDGGWSN